MIVGIVQARMSSTRLPGKVLMPLAGRPMLARQIERLRRAQRIDQLIVATTVDPADEAIATLSSELSVESYRASAAAMTTLSPASAEDCGGRECQRR